MKILITGIRGFIGTNLRPELTANGHHVVGVDIESDNQGCWVADMSQPGQIAIVLSEVRPDVVVHLAAHVGRIFGEDDRSHTVRMNAEATALLAAACGERGIRMVYASSSEVYGDHGGEWCDEDTPWKIPFNLYGLSKGWGEQACRLYAPAGLVIVRLSMPYGPGVPPGRGRRAMDTMLHQAIHRQPITVHRGAERSWCWVGDTVRGIRLAMEAAAMPSGILSFPKALTAEQAAEFKAEWRRASLTRPAVVLAQSPTFTRLSHDVYNVGRDDDPRSMLEIAQMACKLAGASDDLIQEIDPPADQIAVKRLRVDRLRALGWAPTVGLEDGMARVFEWVSGYDQDGNR